MKFNKNIFICFFIGLFLPLYAQNILVIHTYDHLVPWTIDFEKGLKSISEQLDLDIVYFVENLDVSRFGEEDQLCHFSDFLQHKYKDTKFDAVIGNSGQACDFIEDYCDFPDTVPRVYYGSNKTYVARNILNLETNFEDVTEKTLKLVNTIFPLLEELVLIAGDHFITSTVYAKLQSFTKSSHIKSLKVIENYSFDELKTQLSLLTPTTAVFYMPVIMDKEKTIIIPKELLAELTQISAAPIFTLWDTLVGNGSVGGYVISSKKVAEVMIQEALHYLEKGFFITEQGISSCVLDWTAMKKYSLDIASIPSQTRVINKPVPYYITHAKSIIRIANAILIIFLIFLLMGTFLIIKANIKLRIVNEDLKKAREKADSLSRRDSLTNLFNRRAIEPLIEYEQKRKKRFDTPISLLSIDIDFFKKVNDTYGHDVGDIVLKIVAETLRTVSRITDTVARWGGEEFIVLLPDTKEEQAFILAEKMRNEIKNLVIPEANQITVSIGIAENASNESFDDWFKKADSALYEAKKTGRDKSVLASGLDITQKVDGQHNDFSLFELKWRDEFSIGVDTYDTQHQDLFIISNNLVHAVVAKAEKHIISTLLHALFTQTQKHFTDEEKYLTKRNCSFIDEHKKEHTRLLDYLKEKIIQFDDHTISTFDFGSFIYNDLVVKHILEDDKKSFDAIRK